MTTKTANIHARIQPSLKTRVENILHRLGLSTSEAILLYFNQIDMQKSIPFEVKIADVKVPNKKTKNSIIQARKDLGKRSFSSTEDLIKSLNAKN
jgi:DNA-damage-inducible protein J